jgi:CRISPR-associated protein Csx17
MAFAEGRVQVSGRTATDALDFARAVASLGVQRGISSFQRYGYLQRFGRNVIAVPIDRFDVRGNPRGELIDEMDDWLMRFRRLARRTDPPPPARLRVLVARLEDALFDLARSQQPVHVQGVLIRLGEAQQYLARSVASRALVPPVPRLTEQWVRHADDGTDEFRIAAALAGLHGVSAARDGDERRVLPMVIHFAPIAGRNRWLEGGGHDVTWAPGRLTDNLARLAARRLLAGAEMSLADGPWEHATTARLGPIGAWLAGGLDDDRIAALLQGLVLTRSPAQLQRIDVPRLPIPPAFSILKPLLTPRRQLARSGLLAIAGEGDAGPKWTGGRDAAVVVRLLAANRVKEAVTVGARRLRVNGLPVLDWLQNAAHPEGKRLLAALLVPLPPHDLREAVGRVLLPKEDREERLASIPTNETEP